MKSLTLIVISAVALAAGSAATLTVDPVVMAGFSKAPETPPFDVAALNAKAAAFFTLDYIDTDDI